MDKRLKKEEKGWGEELLRKEVMDNRLKRRRSRRIDRERTARKEENGE